MSGDDRPAFSRKELAAFHRYCAGLADLARATIAGFSGGVRRGGAACTGCVRHVPAGIPTQLDWREHGYCPACVFARELDAALERDLGGRVTGDVGPCSCKGSGRRPGLIRVDPYQGAPSSTSTQSSSMRIA